MDYVTEFPHIHMDRRPRKRLRLDWDFNQLQRKAQSGMYNEPDVGNMTSFRPLRALSDHASLFEKGLAQKASPPWRDDDKDGHYMFALGENLTSRYKICQKVGKGTFGQVLECWDRETKEMVAIKVVRSIKKYWEVAMMELEVFQLLGKYDRNGGRYT